MGRLQTAEHQRNIGDALRGRPLSPSHRKAIGDANRGLKRTAEMNKANRQRGLNQKPATYEARAKMSSVRKGRRCNAADFWDNVTPDERRALTEPARKAFVKKYEDPVFQDEQTRKILRAVNQRPNKLEAVFGELLDDLFPSQYEYVGGGQLVLCGKCPDFANVNGQKKLIEVFGDYWHRDQDPAWRIALFARLGFQTLVVWESELTNEPEMVVARLQEFHDS